MTNLKHFHTLEDGDLLQELLDTHANIYIHGPTLALSYQLDDLKRETIFRMYYGREVSRRKDRDLEE